MNVLVTGAAGLTGGAIVRALVARGHRVTALVRRPEAVTLLPQEVTPLVGDCTDAAMMESALRGQDVCVHGAGILLGSALASLDSVRELRGLVVLSSAGVYSRHRASATAYRAGEEAIRGAFPTAAVLRPTMIYGSRRDRNIHHVIAFAARFRALPLFGDGRACLQPIHYEDLAAAAVALVGDGAGGTVDAGGERPLALRELLLEVFAALGLPPRLFRLPVGPALAAAALLDLLRGSRWRERVERLTEDRQVDNSALIARTGLRPRPFGSGLAAEVREMRGA